MTIKIKKILPGAVVPEYGTAQAACFDLVAAEDVQWKRVHAEWEVQPGVLSTGQQYVWVATVRTGLKFEVPVGFALKLYPRSGTGFKQLIQLGNGTGIIDADYRGEVFVKLVCLDPSQQPEDLEMPAGTKICQASIEKMEMVTFDLIGDDEELSETVRGEGGLGSTGKMTGK